MKLEASIMKSFSLQDALRIFMAKECLQLCPSPSQDYLLGIEGCGLRRALIDGVIAP